MTMKNLYKSALALALALVVGCTSDFDEINKLPGGITADEASAKYFHKYSGRALWAKSLSILERAFDPWRPFCRLFYLDLAAIQNDGRDTPTIVGTQTLHTTG